MKKKIFTAITAAVCCIGAVPAMVSSGANISPETGVSCLKGDANLDTKASVADSVAILQHIANRDKYGLSPQGLINADVDGVEGVTGNDALELQKQDSMRFAETSPGISKASYTAKMDWTMGQTGFTDDIWSRIKDGYSGVITSTDELNAYLSEICTEANISKYSVIYNEDFFADNVLFMNAISQGVGGECALTIESLSIGNDGITVNTRYASEITEIAVMSVCLGQVAFAKEAYNGQPVTWTCNSGKQVVPPDCAEEPVCTSRVDYTMGYSGFKNHALSNPIGGKLHRYGYAGVITNTDELKAYLSEVCTDEKIDEYAKLYDEGYFAEKVLFMDVIEQSSGAHSCLNISSVEFGDTITVNAEFDYSGALECIMSVCVGVVELPKGAYNGQPVVWTCNDKSATSSPAESLSSSARIDWYCDTGKDMRPEIWDVLENGNYSAVITSSAELEEYLSKVFRKELVTEYLDFYNGFFEQCVLLVNCELQGSGGEAMLSFDGASYSDDRDVINVELSWQYSEGDSYVDMVSVCFEQVKIPKEQYTGQTVSWNIK